MVVYYFVFDSNYMVQPLLQTDSNFQSLFEHVCADVQTATVALKNRHSNQLSYLASMWAPPCLAETVEEIFLWSLF